MRKMDRESHGDRTRLPIYTASDAQRIVHVHPVSARRWLEGYHYVRNGERRRSPAKLGPDARRVDDVLLMSFQDMLEVRIAHALRRHRITWKNVQAVANFLRDHWGSPHPFALRRLRADGRSVFVDIGSELNDVKVMELGRNQLVFDSVVSPSLFDVVDFSAEGAPVRLWPIGRREMIVVDPAHAFGQPIIDKFGIAVHIIVAAYAANDNDAAAVARWYDLPIDAVDAAIRFDAATRAA